MSRRMSQPIVRMLVAVVTMLSLSNVSLAQSEVPAVISCSFEGDDPAGTDTTLLRYDPSIQVIYMKSPDTTGNSVSLSVEVSAQDLGMTVLSGTVQLLQYMQTEEFKQMDPRGRAFVVGFFTYFDRFVLKFDLQTPGSAAFTLKSSLETEEYPFAYIGGTCASE